MNYHSHDPTDHSQEDGVGSDRRLEDGTNGIVRNLVEDGQGTNRNGRTNALARFGVGYVPGATANIGQTYPRGQDAQSRDEEAQAPRRGCCDPSLIFFPSQSEQRLIKDENERIGKGFISQSERKTFILEDMTPGGMK